MMMGRFLQIASYTVFLLAALHFCSCSGVDEDYIEPIDVETIEKPSAIQVIAHRGCWSGDSLPQNSIASFRQALQQNIYGTEFDVHQTLDDKLVVNHDATFYGMEIARTSYNDLCAKTLPNGETIPLLEDFVKTYVSTNSKVLMVVELKACRVDDVLAIIRQYDMLSHVCFISFSKRLCNDLVHRGFGAITYYLGGDLTPQEVLNAGYGGIDYSHSALQEHPDWIPQAQRLGLWTGVWTVNDPSVKKSYLADSVIVTTDNVFSGQLGKESSYVFKLLIANEESYNVWSV